MPAGLIEEQDCVCSGADLNRDLIEMELHGFAVAGWQHQRGSGPKLGTDRTEQIGRLGALIVNGARARALSGPAIGQLVLLAVYGTGDACRASVGFGSFECPTPVIK